MGETTRCLLGKLSYNVIGPDVVEVASSSQLCAGQLCGCEAAFHAIRDLFSSTNCEAVLLVDVNIAFNSINCQNALRNIRSQCPALATVVINYYHLNLPLFIDHDIIFSAEGTTQGDPLAMIFYAIGILPFIWTRNRVHRFGMRMMLWKNLHFAEMVGWTVSEGSWLRVFS